MVSAEGFATLTTEALARLTRSSARTVRRWRASGLMPRWAFDLLTLLLYRPLGMLADDWEGWHLKTGVIEAPNGYQFTPGELMTIPMRLQEIAALKVELAATRAVLSERQEFLSAPLIVQRIRITSQLLDMESDPSQSLHSLDFGKENYVRSLQERCRDAADF